MTTAEIIQEIRSYCLANANAERLKTSQRFFKEEFVGYGLTAPQIYSKVKEMLKNGGFDLKIIQEAAPILMKGGMYEEISMALLLLDGLWKQFTPETFQTHQQLVLIQHFQLGSCRHIRDVYFTQIFG